MSDATANLALPYIQPSQAQKHVTHNEALRLLDAVVQLVVPGLGETVPPADPEDGARHIVGDGATLEWAGQDQTLAVYDQNAWVFLTPRTGWRARVLADQRDAVFDGAAWVFVTSDLADLEQLGVNATANATDRLTVAAAATLLTHDGSDHRLKVNKATVPDTASLLFQSGFSGRAEMGLAGDDSFSVKVSADGTSWYQGLKVDPAAQTISLAPDATRRVLLSAAACQIDVAITGTAVQASATDTSAGKLLTVGAFGLGATSGHPAPGDNANLCVVPGLNYRFSSEGTNAPLPDPLGGTLHVFAGTGGSRLQQMFVSANGLDKWLRASADTGATWTAWSKCYSQGNVLGTVTQSAGVPTGAVIERGSNANGDYARFADGTQLCWSKVFVGDATTPVGSLFRWGANQTWVFPAAFALTPTVLPGSTNNAQICWPTTAQSGAVSATVCLISALSVTGRAATYAAVGRWF